jgi:hypothetical protein
LKFALVGNGRKNRFYYSSTEPDIFVNPNDPYCRDRKNGKYFQPIQIKLRSKWENFSKKKTECKFKFKLRNSNVQFENQNENVLNIWIWESHAPARFRLVRIRRKTGHRQEGFFRSIGNQGLLVTYFLLVQAS